MGCGQRTCGNRLGAFSVAQILYLIALAVFPAIRAVAAGYTWDGGGTSNNWSDPFNWSTNAPPFPGADTTLTFGSGPRNVSTQNTIDPFMLNALSFDNLGTQYFIDGGTLDFRASGTNVAPTLNQNTIFAVKLDNRLALTNTVNFGGGGTGNLTLAGRLTGASGLNKNNGNSTLLLSGTGSAISFLSVNAGAARLTGGGQLNLSATGSTGFGGNSSLFVEAGATFAVEGGSVLNTNGTPQIHNNGQITLTGGSTTWTNTPATAGGADEIRVGYAGATSNLTVDAGAAVLTGGLRLGKPAFNGHGNLTVKNGGSVQTGTLTLDDATTTLTADGGALNAGAINELTPGAVISIGNGGSFTVNGNTDSTFGGTLQNLAGQTSAGNLVKSGTGTLTLSGTSSGFSGGVTLTAGSLGVGSNTALGTGTITGNGGTLFASGAGRTLSNAFAVNAGKTLNLVTAAGDVHNLALNGVISGPSTGNVVINAPGGTVTYGGSVRNSFSGLTSVTAGTLALNKALGVNVAVAGDLSIGNAASPGPAGSAVVRALDFNPFDPSVDVSIYADGLLDFNGQPADIGSLTMTGGEVKVGFFLDYLHGNLTTKASDSTARITVPNGGGVELENPNNTFDIARGTAMYDLDVQGRILLHGFTKTGPGILRLAGQGNSGLSVTLSAGAIAAASNTALDTGTFTMAGGTFVADGGDRTLGNAVNVTGNATIGSSLDGTPRALTFTGPTSLAPAATLTVSNNAATTFAGVVSGTGGIVKNGPATLTLSSTANSFTGGLTLNGGTLAVAADGSLGAPDNLVTLNAGRLQFAGNATSSRAFIMSDGVTLAPAAGGTLTYAGGASVNGGFLAAGGTHAFTDGSSLNGTTTALDSSLTTTGAVSFTNVTLRGAATQNAGTLSATDTLITSAGSLDVNGTMTAAALENDGVLRVNTGGTLNNTSGKLVSGGGALLAVATGGTLNLQNNTSLELRGSLLTNNGTVTGTTNVHFNSLASGAGTYGPVNLFENGRFAPGASAAPIFQPAAVAAATAAFAPNTTLAIEIGGAIPGTTFDQVKVAGNATLNGTLAITTTNNFEPAPLQQFQVVTFATRTGHFTGYTGQEIPHGLAYAPVYSATDLKLIATLPGDATLDGAVDFNDLVKLAQNYNTTLTTDNWWSSGDFTVDGRVDFNDLVKLAQNYNTDLLPAAPIPDSLATDWALAQAATVPEPTVGFVLMVLTLSWRRRSQS